MNEWISVEDRLPKSSVDVLVFIPTYDGEIDIGFLSGDEWVLIGEDSIRVRVSHWMPLPEPPEVK